MLCPPPKRARRRRQVTGRRGDRSILDGPPRKLSGVTVTWPPRNGSTDRSGQVPAGGGGVTRMAGGCLLSRAVGVPSGEVVAVVAAEEGIATQSRCADSKDRVNNVK